jgi:hypothetical protein
MILKIRKEFVDSFNSGWIYIDNIKECTTEDWGNYKVRLLDDKEAKKEGSKYRIVGFSSNVKKNQLDEHVLKYDRIFLRWKYVEDYDAVRVAQIRFNNNTFAWIVFQTEAFLLSDDGKTIERLSGVNKAS